MREQRRAKRRKEADVCVASVRLRSGPDRTNATLASLAANSVSHLFDAFDRPSPAREVPERGTLAGLRQSRSIEEALRPLATDTNRTDAQKVRGPQRHRSTSLSCRFRVSRWRPCHCESYGDRGKRRYTAHETCDRHAGNLAPPRAHVDRTCVERQPGGHFGPRTATSMRTARRSIVIRVEHCCIARHRSTDPDESSTVPGVSNRQQRPRPFQYFRRRSRAPAASSALSAPYSSSSAIASMRTRRVGEPSPRTSLYSYDVCLGA